MSDDTDPDDAATRGASPSAAEIRAQLERILRSKCFETAGRASQFLRYVVEETLAGRGERLKGYTLAVEVFERSADFDAQTDPLVRVEAGRLRRRLIEYYAGEGRNDPLLIDLPRGSYVATCSYTAHAAADGKRPPPLPREVWRGRTPISVIALAVVVVGAIVIAVSGVLAPREPVERAIVADVLASGGSATIAVVPLEVLDADDRLRTLAATVTEELLIELDEHELFATAIQSAAFDAERAAPALAPADSNRYVLTGTVRSTPDGVRVTARLALESTGAQLWSASYDEAHAIADLHPQQTALARRIASVAAPYGPVFEAELAHAATLPPEELRTSDCVLKYYEYRSSQGPTSHDSALRCFEQAVRRMPELANSWAGLALLLLDVFTFGYADVGDGIRAAALERAGDVARTAMDIDGDSLLANLALARVLFLTGADFERTAQRAISLCPNNIEALSLLGGLFVLAGDAERGLAMVDRAIELAPDPPGNYYAFKALGELRVRDHEGALAAALRIDAPNWYIGHLVVTATAALAGRDDIAARSRARAVELYPAAERELPELFDRFRMTDDLRAELRRGFNAAGRNVP